MSKKKKRILVIILAIVFLIACGITWYLKQYYPASEAAMDVVTSKHDYQIVEEANQQIAFVPENPKAGLIFYPGAKVQYEAYAPLMDRLASNGMLCVLLHMPCNLAILDQNAADGIQEQYPQVTEWYIGGHSLGGAMAASYVSKHAEQYSGLLLLAAYSTKDLKDTDLKVLCVYGSNDQVMKKKRWEECLNNLPKGYITFEIEGGNHGYFGDYGEQKGDGTATVRREEQIESTVDAVMSYLEF